MTHKNDNENYVTYGIEEQGRNIHWEWSRL